MSWNEYNRSQYKASDQINNPSYQIKDFLWKEDEHSSQSFLIDEKSDRRDHEAVYTDFTFIDMIGG